MRLLLAPLALAIAVLQGCTCVDTVRQTRFACQDNSECLPGNVCRGGECRATDVIPEGVCFAGETQACTPASCARTCGEDAGWQACAPATGPGFLTNPLNCGECGRQCSPRLGESLGCVDGRCTCTKDFDCPSGDVCGPGGVCVMNTDPCARVVCDPGTVCRAGSCAAVGCDQGCAAGEVCDVSSAQCRPILPCRFAAPCGDGGICEGAPEPDGEPCNDGVACTFGDVCAFGACRGTSYACPAATQCQQAVACAGDGGCEVTAMVDGTPCDDGVACTFADQCVSGACGGSAYTCTPDQCAATSACNGDGGCEVTPRNVGEACDDNQPCSFGDSCSDAGQCVGTSYACPGITECKQAGVCLGDGGCDVVDKANGTPCDDGQACTASDSCTSGVCGGTALTSYRDFDGDGKGDDTVTEAVCPLSAGYVLDAGDCNDANAFVLDVLPAATDADQDGVTAATSLNPTACVGPSSLVSGRAYYRNAAGAYTWLATASVAADCNDADPDVFESRATMVIDVDHDGYAAGAASTQCVGASATFNGRTYYANTAGAFVYLDSSAALAGTDCLDSNASVFTSRAAATDADHDSFTTTTTTSTQCVGASSVINTRTYYDDASGAASWLGSASAAADCNDANASITGTTLYYVDADTDGFGAGTGTARCAPVSGEVSNNTDCLDSNGNIFTSLAAAIDVDHDGLTTTSSTSTQCVGAPSLINTRTYYADSTGAATWLGSASATVDCNDANAGTGGPVLYYADTDGDGFGAGTGTSRCAPVGSEVSNNTDCNAAAALEYRLISSALDQDQDGYATTAVASNCVGAQVTANGRTYYYEITAGGNAYVLGTQVIATTDCNPTNGAVVAAVNSVVPDDDQDGYPPVDTTQNISCAGPLVTAFGRNYYADGSGGWWLEKSNCIGKSGNNCPLDCYDLNASAHLGQTSYFTSSRGDGSFDYDCSGTTTSLTTSGTYCASVSSGVVTYSDPGVCSVVLGSANVCNTPTGFALPGACGKTLSAGTTVNVISGTCTTATVAGSTVVGCH